MLIKYLKYPINTKTDILFNCDKCGIEYRRNIKSYNKMKENICYDKDYCPKCWRTVLNNRTWYKEKMSKSLVKRFSKQSERDKLSLATKGKINLGDANGMKQKEARKKVSNARIKMFKDENLRKEYAEKTRLAWKEGKFDGVRVGCCKWYEYMHSSGQTYKVQGTWELAFIKWLDATGLTFKCHKGRLEYIIEGEAKNYYPDFWVDEWECYVDVKSRHWYNEEKFEAIKNSGHNVRILFKEDLERLGVVWHEN
jgi:hypothetical protein